MIKIRKAQCEDKEKLICFFKALSNKTNYFFNRTGQNKKQTINYILNSRNKTYIPFVAEQNGIITGLLILYNLDKKVIKLSIGVSDEYQGRGIGNLLMEYAKKYAQKKKKGGISLTTHYSNKKAQSLYKKHGYQLRGSEENEFIYVLDLPECL